jgi:hypothetical protein
MKELIFFTLMLCLLLYTSCSHPISTKEQKPNTSKKTTDSDAKNTTSVSKKRDPKTIDLEVKLVELLKVELRNKDYQQFFVKYENYLLREGALKSKDGKGYLDLLKKTLKSGDIYGGILPISGMKDFEESDKMNLRGFVTVTDKVENEIKALPENSPLKIYAKIIEDVRESGDVSISKIFTTLVSSLDEKTLDNDFYQEYTLLFLLGVTK